MNKFFGFEDLLRQFGLRGSVHNSSEIDLSLEMQKSLRTERTPDLTLEMTPMVSEISNELTPMVSENSNALTPMVSENVVSKLCLVIPSRCEILLVITCVQRRQLILHCGIESLNAPMAAKIILQRHKHRKARQYPYQQRGLFTDRRFWIFPNFLGLGALPLGEGRAAKHSPPGITG